jgi:hypothetical protein
MGIPQLRQQTAQTPQYGLNTAQLIRTFAIEEGPWFSSTRQPLIATFPYKPPGSWPKAGSVEEHLLSIGRQEFISTFLLRKIQ